MFIRLRPTRWRSGPRADGNLYGVANFVSGTGVVYEVTASGAVTILARSPRRASIGPCAWPAPTDPSMAAAATTYFAIRRALASIIGAPREIRTIRSPTPGSGCRGHFFRTKQRGRKRRNRLDLHRILARPWSYAVRQPVTLTLGQAATLTWSSTGETTCAASGAWSGAKLRAARSRSPQTALGAIPSR